MATTHWNLTSVYLGQANTWPASSANHCSEKQKEITYESLSHIHTHNGGSLSPQVAETVHNILVVLINSDICCWCSFSQQKNQSSLNNQGYFKWSKNYSPENSQANYYKQTFLVIAKGLLKRIPQNKILTWAIKKKKQIKQGMEECDFNSRIWEMEPRAQWFETSIGYILCSRTVTLYRKMSLQ